MNDDNFDRLFKTGFVFCGLLAVAFLAAIVFVAAHFIGKVW